MEQSERLTYLTEEFIKDSEGYRDLAVPEDDGGKRRLLRSLMNVRSPRSLPPRVLEVQDEYLTIRAREQEPVDMLALPTLAEQGSRHPFGDRLSLWQGDITRLKGDAIVNAANEQMLGCFVPMHTCIDNCIHTYAGVQLRLECNEKMQELRRIHGPGYTQPTAVPMLTKGYNLPAKYVVHIVGPIVAEGLTPGLEQDLADCYTNSLELCREEGLRTVAFCCISTGVFRFPADRAAKIALAAVSGWMAAHPDTMDRVVFNVFKDEDKLYYEEAIQQFA